MTAPELKKESIRDVSAAVDPKTGKLQITININPERIDPATADFLKHLTGKTPAEILERLGDASTGSIESKLKETIASDIDKKSKALGNPGKK